MALVNVLPAMFRISIVLDAQAICELTDTYDKVLNFNKIYVLPGCTGIMNNSRDRRRTIQYTA